MLTTTELTSFLRAHRLRLTKRLGQHHLVDARTIDRILEACQLSRNDTVVEIGAGLGALTEGLAQRAKHVYAVEVDRRVAQLLSERMRSWGNVTVVCQDILSFSWAQARGAVVVGAIPYHITSPILVWLSESHQEVQKSVLVLQREVAQRLTARSDTKAYGRLSVLGQYRWQLTARFVVSRSAFFPRPAVDSVCLELLRRVRPPVRVEDEAWFFAVVKAVFAHRRKTAANCLASGLLTDRSRADIEQALQGLGVPITVRGEALSLEQLAALANALQL